MCSRKAKEEITQVECAFSTMFAKYRHLHCQEERRCFHYLANCIACKRSHISHSGYNGKRYKNQILSLAVPVSAFITPLPSMPLPCHLLQTYDVCLAFQLSTQWTGFDSISPTPISHAFCIRRSHSCPLFPTHDQFFYLSSPTPHSPVLSPRCVVPYPSQKQFCQTNLQDC